MVIKIKSIVEVVKLPKNNKRVDFIKQNKDYLTRLGVLSAVEMELINKGMGIEEAIEEAKNIIRLSSI